MNEQISEWRINWKKEWMNELKGGISEWINKSMTNVWRMIGWIYKAIVVIGMSDSDNEIALFIQLEIRLLNQIINDQTTIPGMGWKVFNKNHKELKTSSECVEFVCVAFIARQSVPQVSWQHLPI